MAAELRRRAAWTALVRTFKPSDGVKLTVIRKGEVMSLDATLVEKELPELSAVMFGEKQQRISVYGLPCISATSVSREC